jgi:synaptojanin
MLRKYREMAIEFKPTFKYDKWSDQYDTSKKMRVPSYTDRILWFHKEQYIVPLSYESKDNRFSDHRPVVGYFKVMAHQHVEEMKQ